MRSSLATALVAWSMLTGLGLVFAQLTQLTQLQGFTAPGHPEVRWAYAVFDGSLFCSALVGGVGGLPLWLLMLRRADGDPAPAQLAVCQQLRRLHLTVWYALYTERMPELGSRAAEFLALWPAP